MGIKSLLDLPRDNIQNMSREDSETVVMAIMSESEQKKNGTPHVLFDDDMPDFEKTKSGGMILNGRLKLDETKITVGCAIVALVFSKGRPGNIVLWAYTFNRLYRSINKERPVDMALLSNWFPAGFPTEEGYHQIWELQKDDNRRNLLDKIETWQSDWEVPERVTNLPPAETFIKECKTKALSELNNTKEGRQMACAALGGMMGEHPDLRNHPGLKLMLLMQMSEEFESDNDVQEFIEGFNV